MRFIATSDWHLGMHANYLNEEARPRFQQAREALERMGEVAEQKGARFIVAAGDLFESNHVGPEVVATALKALRGLPVPIYLVPGNHDPLDAASVYDRPAFKRGQPPNVHIIRDSKPIDVDEDAQLVGVPWASKFPTVNHVEKLWDELGPAPSNKARIVVAHGAADTLVPDTSGPEAADPELIEVRLAEQAIAEGNADFVVLGDRHSTTEVASGVWYPGSPEVTHRVDTDAGNVLLVEVDVPEASAVSHPAKATVEVVPVGVWSYLVEDAELLDASSVDQLVSRLDHMKGSGRIAMWLRLSGALTSVEKARFDAELERLRPTFAKLDIWSRYYDLAVIPDGEDFSDLGLSGVGSAALEELLEDADSGDQDALGALNLLYRLVQEGKQ